MAFEWRFDFALKTAAPVSARELFTRTAIRLAVNALEFYVAARLRRPCLDRFAVFAKASRNSPAARSVGSASGLAPVLDFCEL